ncbi:MAG: 4'-phosphopantetheinyl transferase superfamily protein [Clostridia bacterium]|nr:4'-phosphopantetheinyl transferase superfamily protein [Clostridia bacterium]
MKKLIVYLLDINIFKKGENFSKYYQFLSDYRKNKINGIKGDKDKLLSLGAGVLLDFALKKYNLNEKDMEYSFNDNNKPYFFSYPFIFFNISHSKEKVVLVVSDIEVGCDIEYIKNANLSMAKRFFSEYENKYLFSLEESARNREFFKLWVAKESVVKACGKGLKIPLSSFTCDLLKNTTKIENELYFYKEVHCFDDYICFMSCKEDFEVEKIDLKLT